MIDPGLQEKVVLITGANNPIGIGAAAAHAFARQGAKVAITYLRLPPDKHGFQVEEVSRATEMGLPYYHALRMKTAEELLQLIQADGAQAQALEIDLTIPDNIPLVFDWAEQVIGPVDILVNNAAHYDARDTIVSTTFETIEQTFAVNVRAAVLLMAEFVKRQQARQARFGRIINLSTDAAQVFAGQIAYGASKAAMEAFTRSVAIETGSMGITVNAIAPGPVQTGYISNEFENKIAKEIPLGRIGYPEDIANAIVFLASEQASWITGQVIKVSGGHAI